MATSITPHVTEIESAFAYTPVGGHIRHGGLNLRCLAQIVWRAVAHQLKELRPPIDLQYRGIVLAITESLTSTNCAQWILGLFESPTDPRVAPRLSESTSLEFAEQFISKNRAGIEQALL